MISHGARRQVRNVRPLHVVHPSRPAVWLLGVAGLMATGRLCAADTPLPEAATILDRYVEVTGGRAAYAKIQNRVYRGHMTFVGMDIEAPTTVYVTRPNKYYSVSDSEALGKIENGSDGKTVWYLSPQTGPVVIDGAEKAAILRTYSFDSPVDWRASYKKVVCEGEETVEGEACYKLTLTSNEDKAQARFYSKESGLLVRLQTTREMPQVPPMPIDEIISDYKRVDGLLIPHRRKQIMKQCGTTREILFVTDKIEHNVELPASRFDLPDEIRDAVKKGATGGNTKPGPAALGSSCGKHEGSSSPAEPGQ